jgi:hypothetical protein
MLRHRSYASLVLAALALALALGAFLRQGAPSRLSFDSVAMAGGLRALDSPGGMVGEQKVATGQSKTVFKSPDFTVTGKCVDHGGGSFEAQGALSIKGDNALYYDSHSDTAGVNLPSGTTVNFGHSAQGTGPAFASSDNSDVVALSSRGKVIVARLASGVHVHGADCVFAGMFLSNSAGH